MERDNISIWDIVLAPLFIIGAGYAIYDAVRDMRRGENRPPVTDKMIEEAFARDIMLSSDEEMENMDWMGDDD